MILDNKALWDSYNALPSEKDKHLFLKNYLLSLPPDDLYHYLLEDIDTLGINMIDLIAKGDLQAEQSLELDKSLDTIINTVERTRFVAKAA